MIDVLIPIYKNYDLLYQQVAHWPKIAETGTYRLLFSDTTPAGERKDLPPSIDGHPIHVNCIDGPDGVTHGGTLDFLARQATSDIVCIVDSDFFWLKKGILEYAKELIDDGLACVGTQLFHRCTHAYWRLYPQRQYLPSLPALFMKRQLAVEQTFIVNSQEIHATMETGWRLRQRLLDDNLPYLMFPGFYCQDPIPEEYAAFADCIVNAVYYGFPTCPIGVHLLQGSWGRMYCMGAMQYIIDKFEITTM